MEIDRKQPPQMVSDTQASEPGREIYLQWDGAMDDEGHLRKCPVCKCDEFFVRKDLPQITAFVLVLIAAAIAVAFYAADLILASIVVLVAVTLVDIMIFFMSEKKLVCYRCHSSFKGLPLAGNQHHWDGSTGDRYRKESQGTSRENFLSTRYLGLGSISSAGKSSELIKEETGTSSDSTSSQSISQGGRGD